MKIERPDPRIGAIATDVDVRALSDADWNDLYRAWLDGIVLVDEAYAECKRITHQQARNFSYGIRLLPAQKRSSLSVMSDSICCGGIPA